MPKINLQKGLVGRWKMSEIHTDSQILRDRSGNKAHMTIEGGVSQGQSSIFGESFQFNGDDGWCYNDQGVSASNFSEIMVFMWASDPSGRGFTQDNTFQLFPRRGSSVGGYIHTKEDGWVTVGGDRTIDTGSHSDPEGPEDWDFYGFGLGSDGTFRSVINDEIIDQNVNYSFDGRSNNRVTAGNRYSGDFWYEGKISECRFYKRLLTHEEIVALYNIRNMRVRNS